MKRWIAIVLLAAVSRVGVWADGSAATHWAFQPIREPALPAVTNLTWCQTPIDRFILARLEQLGTAPAPSAGRRTLLRRASLDLTGLPPSAEELDAFAADASPDAWSKRVERLLESPHYGEHWGRHWLDVVRYADTAGETADYPVPVAWRYRNYVIAAFNADKPYDEFLREQIAGDVLAQRGPRERYAERITATGYLAISRRFGFDSENYHHLTIQDTIDTLGQTVLGLTLGCARCHAHKYDPISLPDYYALYGIFDSTRYAFPGSEQKQRSRAMVPLCPPEESQAKWRQYELEIASLAADLQRQKVSVPSVVLRSTDDLDGDFEMQAPAAGGSKGVLVPPWVYDGPIAVTTEAQSPFKNVHPSGRVGANITAGTNAYRIVQSLHPARSRDRGGPVYVNLDFKVATNEPTATGAHRFWLGASPSSAAVEVWLAADHAIVQTGDRRDTVRFPRPHQWQSLRLTLDLAAGTVSGSLDVADDQVVFAARPLAPDWKGSLARVGFDGGDGGKVSYPAVTFDNLAIQEVAFAPVSTSSLTVVPPRATGLDPATVNETWRQWVGLDGDFELQTADSPPSAPWGPGPQSVVRIRAASQSPFHNIYPAGQRGVFLPNSGAYNGFGQTLPQRWEVARTPKLYASFDFRCGDSTAGGEGTWRYYLGHGAGGSAAVELGFNAHEFFRRSGDARDAVASLQSGEWYQVQIAVDLKEKSYQGSLTSRAGRTEFSGALASGWDGSIDYTFIDSYGHRPGVKPALDADNFALGEQPWPSFEALAVTQTPEQREARELRAKELRQQMAAVAAAAEQAKQKLEGMLVEGPFDMAYGVSEGTPHNARVQLRGEPDRLGDEVPRGFLKVLGGGPLPETTSGSGRLELAEWLTRPSNPLTARVMVNRIWQYHFGQGLVKTPNDFGTRGQRPTHPELLDFLAAEFIRSGWSVKAMHRLIMASAVYQQRSQYSLNTSSDPSAAAGVDCPVLPGTQATALPGNGVSTDTFSPFPRRRLAAEEMRDAILLASGELDPSPGEGHPFPSPTGWGFTQHGPFSAVYPHHRRSVYLMNQRIKRHPFLALFDGADPNASTAERRTTTVPTQALFFLNDPFVHESSDQLAARVVAGAQDEGGRIQLAYRMTLGRSPSATEQTEAADFLSAYRTELTQANAAQAESAAFAALARVLFGTNEFLTVD